MQRTYTPSSYWARWIKSLERWPALHAIAVDCHATHTDEQRRDSSICPACKPAYQAELLNAKRDRVASMEQTNAHELARYGLEIGDRVACFCPSMLGLGGMTVHGIVRKYRGRVCVDCGRMVDTTAGPRRHVNLSAAWKIAAQEGVSHV